jgi:tetratricopeptide (TPR) repeat protein
MKITTKIIGTIACALLCGALAFAQDSPQQSINSLEKLTAAGTATREQQLDLARAYIQVGRFYEASKLAKGLLDIDPNDAQAAAVRDEAVKSLRATAQQKVTAAEANAKRDGATDEDRLALANAYFEAGDYRSAADAYARLPETVKNRDTRLRHARALAWSSRLDESERIYSQILKEQDTPDVELEYGRLLSWMGATQSARETLNSVYDQNRTEDAAVALANARAWGGDREGAIRLLADFTSTQPNAAQARQLLATMRTAPDLLIERVDKLIELDPFNLALRVQRARLLYEAGRYSESLKTIKFVRDHTRQNIEGLDELEKQARQRRVDEIARLDERRKTLEANTNVSAGMISSSDNADDILELAKAYTGLGAYDQAIALYERYLSVRPDDVQARINYARVLSWDRRYTAAENQYERLVKEVPDRADLRYEYAQTLSYNSDYVDAIHAFRQLTDISDNPRARLYRDVPTKAYFSLGQIYRWFGWNETAVEQQNRAIALDSSFAPAREELTLARYRRPATTLGATYGFAEDSTNFQFRRLDFDGQKWVSSRTAIEGSIGRHEFSRNGDDIYATAASVGGRYRWQDRWTARARVGANFYDSGLGSRPFWNLGADWLPSIQSRLSFDYNHYDLVYDVFNLAALTPVSPIPGSNFRHPLDIDDFRSRAAYDTGGHWSFLGDASYGFVSDDNKRQALHGLASFRLLKRPFVAIKGEGRYLSYDFRTNRYWSPTDYKSYAAVLQVGQNFRNHFFVSAEVKAGRAYEQNRSSDLRSYVGTISIPVSDVFDVVGSYGYGKSGRFDSVFGTGNDFTNYWQRNWYVGVRLKRLFSSDDRRPEDRYYYDNRVLSGSPVLPPVGETH